jgi:hypothetical protein
VDTLEEILSLADKLRELEQRGGLEPVGITQGRQAPPIEEVPQKVGSQMNRNLETKIVKQALQRAGYKNIRVGHGHGTAWGWLEVRVTADRTPQCDCRENDVMICDHCRQIDRDVTELVMKVTDRHGEYDGNTSVRVELVPEKAV